MGQEIIKINEKNVLIKAGKILKNLLVAVSVLSVVNLKLKCGLRYGVTQELNLVKRYKNPIFKQIYEDCEKRLKTNRSRLEEFYNVCSSKNHQCLNLANNPEHFELIYQFFKIYIDEFKSAITSIISMKIANSKIDSEIVDLSFYSGLTKERFKDLSDLKEEIQDIFSFIDESINIYSQKRDLLNDFITSTENSFLNEENLTSNRNQATTYTEIEVFNFLNACINEPDEKYTQMFFCTVEQMQKLNIRVVKMLNSLVSELKSIKDNYNYKI